MKVLCINDCDYYEMFEGVYDLKSLNTFLNVHYQSFVIAKKYDDSECIAPYLINQQKEECLNISAITNFSIADVEVLEEDEYLRRLKKVVKEHCVNCINYQEGDDLSSHRDRISLDGKCFFKELKG